MARTKCIVVIAAAILLAGATGCVRHVVRDSRAQSLDIRVPDPNERMYNTRPNAKPVHEKTGYVDLDVPLTLTRAIDIALESHPEIRRAQARIDGAIARKSELETMGWAEFLTDITYAPDWTLFVNKPRLLTGDVLRPNTTRLDVAIRQPLYFEWERRKAYLNANNEEIARLQVEMEMKKNEVIAQVCKAFLDLAKARQEYEYRRSVYHLDQKRVSLVGKLVKEKMLLASSTSNAIAFMQAARRDAEAAYGVLKSKERVIKNILGIDSRLQVEVQPIAFSEIPLVPMDEAADYLTNRSLAFLALDHEVEKAYWEKVLGRWMDIDLDLYVRYGFDLTDWSTSADDFLLISVAFRYPLMHVKARNARVVRGLKRMEEFEIEREVQQQRILNELETLYATIEENRADMESNLAAIAEARENLRIAQAFEQKGSVDQSLKSDPANVLLSTISAISILNARFKYEEARTKYMCAIMDQYILLGRAAELKEFARKYTAKEEHASDTRGILITQTKEVLESAETQTELFDFCRAESISALYVRLEPAQLSLDSLKTFLKKAHSQRFSVIAVMGDDAWLEADTTEAGESDLKAFFDFQKEASVVVAAARVVVKPKAGAGSHQAFDGLQIDFRGKRLGDWENAAAWPESRKERLLNLIAYAGKSRINTPLGFSMDAAAADFRMYGKTLFSIVCESCNVICLYTRSSNQTDIVARTETLIKSLPEGSEVKIKAAMETSEILPPSQSYFTQGASLMWGESAEIAEKLGRYPNFTGILIDNYHNLQSMGK